MTNLFDTLHQKIAAGVRVTDAEALALFASNDLLAIGELAAYANRLQNGDRVYFNVNRHINYTNLCVNRCTFCAFSKGVEDEGCYTLALNDILEKAAEAAAAGATEIHMVGGLHPDLPFDFYLEMLGALKADLPQLHIKAFTAVEIDYFASLTGQSVTEVIAELKQAGLGSMPGGGAEVFDDRVHDEVFKGKLRSDGWMNVHKVAHELGIATNATILYGHVETRAERVNHLIKLRELQDAAPGFQTIIPLSFIPDGSELGHLPGNTGLEDMKMLAISRLMLPNFPHVKAFWIMQSMKLSQVSLNFGVDDLDGTVVWYDITKREGGRGNQHQEQDVADIRRLVVEAGYIPVERDTLYRRVIRNGQDWHVA